MKFFIPSRARHTTQHIRKGPIGPLPNYLQRRFAYVVPKAEEHLYKAVVPQGVQVIAQPENVRGIAAKRHWIGKMCRDASEAKFAMLDDDIRLIVRRGRDTVKLRDAEPEEVEEMLKAVEHWLDGFAHVGVSAREGNNRVGVGGPDLRADNTRTLRFLCYNTRAFLSVQHERVDLMEDFDVNLQLLRGGHENTNLCYWSQSSGITHAPGGCSEYRTHELHEQCAIRLSELHPDLVRLRDKRNKTDAGGFGTRKEVTIYWKKAAKEGQSKC